jgi:hypothetical protein
MLCASCVAAALVLPLPLRDAGAAYCDAQLWFCRGAFVG